MLLLIACYCNSVSTNINTHFYDSFLSDKAWWMFRVPSYFLFLCFVTLCKSYCHKMIFENFILITTTKQHNILTACFRLLCLLYGLVMLLTVFGCRLSSTNKTNIPKHCRFSSFFIIYFHTLAWILSHLFSIKKKNGGNMMWICKLICSSSCFFFMYVYVISMAKLSTK